MSSPGSLSELEAEYARLCRKPSDINQHLPKLRELASRCRRVTEFGTRDGVSTTAILAAQPKRFDAYDIRRRKRVSLLEQLAGETTFVFHQADVLRIDIADTDMLFIDTWHTYEQCAAELQRHGSRAMKYLVFHDTRTFGTRGEDKTFPGLLQAIDEWLQASPEWHVIYKTDNNNGLMVLERV